MPQEISLFNPNTRTMPVFRTRFDAELSKKIYEHVPVFVNEPLDQNTWDASFRQGLFNMTSDSDLFVDSPFDECLPLYEAKYFHQFDHQWASSDDDGSNDEAPNNKEKLVKFTRTRYFISPKDVELRLGEWQNKWLLCYRMIAKVGNERTAIFSILPRVGVGNSIGIVFPYKANAHLAACLLADVNSLVFDYVTRQKIAGTNLNLFFIKQLPVLPPSAYSTADIDFIAPRVLELVYTAYDLRPFAEDMGYPGEPFTWNEERRAQLRAELDATYARLYGLTRDELRYILDPKEVHGDDFPGETFRVLKDKEIRLYGEYRTRRLVMDAWDKLVG